MIFGEDQKLVIITSDFVSLIYSDSLSLPAAKERVRNRTEAEASRQVLSVLLEEFTPPSLPFSQ